MSIYIVFFFFSRHLTYADSFVLQSKTEFPFFFFVPSGTLKDKAKINSDYRFKICPSFTGWFGGQMRIQQSGCPFVLAQ